MIYSSGNQLIDPQVLFEKVHLRPGAHVADFGCGQTGHLIFPASKIVGEKGIMYGVDVLKDVLAQIDKRAKDSGLVNVHAVWSNVEMVGGTAIPEHSLDTVFIVSLLSFCDKQEDVLKEAARLIREKGRVVIVDWYKKGIPIGPGDEKYIDFSAIAAWATANGFAVQEEFDHGPYHHGLVLFYHAT